MCSKESERTKEEKKINLAFFSAIKGEKLVLTAVSETKVLLKVLGKNGHHVLF